jgi:hypothetical protein
VPSGLLVVLQDGLRLPARGDATGWIGHQLTLIEAIDYASTENHDPPDWLVVLGARSTCMFSAACRESTLRRRTWQVVVTDTLRHRSILPKVGHQVKV